MSIILRDVHFTYMPGTPFERAALRGVSLNIEDGEFVGIIGQTGSGKSTLVQMFNGLLKPTSGEVRVGGVETTGKKVKLKQLRQQVGLVFQFPEHQLFGETVRADVAFGPENQGVKGEELQARVQAALELVRIEPELFDRSPFDLSGGQMRRVAIAGVLAMNPRVLVLDEPTAGLDPRGRDEILQRVVELHRERGITVILVSHSMEDIARLVDRVMVVHQGELKYDGTPREVFRHATQLNSMGLSVPQATLVLQELRSRGWDVPEVALTLEEAKEAILECYRDRGGERA